MPGYTTFQLIAYEVPTDQLLDAGKVTNPQSINLGELATEMGIKVSDDALARLARLICLAEQGGKLAKVDAAPTNLRIFVVPEFYLRPKEKGLASRSYNEDDKKFIIEALSRVFTKKDFADWLFVFGTVLWYSQRLNAVPNTDFDDKSWTVESVKQTPLVYNTAVVVIGGQEKGVIVCNKREYSGADDVDDSNIPSTAKNPQLKRLKEKKSQKSLGDVLKENITPAPIIKVNACWFGLEVCKDHEVGVIDGSWDAWQLENANASLAFQIVIACSMQVHGPSVVLGKGQCVLRVDGISDIAYAGGWQGTLRPSEIQRVCAIDIDNNQAVMAAEYSAAYQNQWTADNKPLAVVRVQDINVELALDVRGRRVSQYRDNKGQVQADVELSKIFPQQLVVYQPIELGKVAK